MSPSQTSFWLWHLNKWRAPVKRILHVLVNEDWILHVSEVVSANLFYQIILLKVLLLPLICWVAASCRLKLLKKLSICTCNSHKLFDSCSPVQTISRRGLRNRDFAWRNWGSFNINVHHLFEQESIVLLDFIKSFFLNSELFASFCVESVRDVWSMIVYLRFDRFESPSM